MIKVELTENDAELFKIFMQFKHTWRILFNGKIRSNKVILHFDSDGNMRKAEYPVILES